MHVNACACVCCRLGCLYIICVRILHGTNVPCWVEFCCISPFSMGFTVHACVFVCIAVGFSALCMCSWFVNALAITTRLKSYIGGQLICSFQQFCSRNYRAWHLCTQYGLIYRWKNSVWHMQYIFPPNFFFLSFVCNTLQWTSILTNSLCILQ